MTNADGEQGTGFRLSFRELGLGCGGRLSIGVGGQVRFPMSKGITLMTSTENVFGILDPLPLLL